MKLRLYVITLIFMGLSCNVVANENDKIEIVTSDLSPYSIEVGLRPGFMVEVLSLIEQRLNRQSPIHYYPWPRSQMLARSNDNHIIFPLTRTVKREKDYDWAIDVAPIEFVFVGFGYEHLTLAQAKQLDRITVQSSTPFESFLLKNGFKNVVASPHASETHLRLLEHNRVQAWFTAKDLAQYALLDNKKMKGLKISEAMHVERVYFAMSKKFPPSLKAEYIRVFNELREDGTIDYILKQYRGPSS